VFVRGEKVKKIGDLFDVYKKRLWAPQDSVISVFVEVVEDVVGLSLSKDKVRYTPSSKTLSVQAPAPIKNEIKIKEAEIMIHLKGRLGEKNTPKHLI